MADFFSRRFVKDVWVTRHARQSMSIRDVDEPTLVRVIEDGEIKRKDAKHLWIYLEVESRSDSPLCAAAVESESLVIKTVMIKWQLEDDK